MALGDSVKQPGDYLKMWIGAGIIGTVANGISRIGGDYLYTDVGLPVIGQFIDNYFQLPQAGFEIVATSYLTMLAVNYIPNLSRPS